MTPPQTVEALRGVTDEVVAVETPETFMAIGQFYADFPQTTDEETARRLATAWAPAGPGPSRH